jgi:hypothetical protein
MQKLFRSVLLAAAALGVAIPASAGELTVTIANGRATVIAQNVPLRQILAEWARVGSTRMVNAEKLTGGPISIELVDMPEKEALDILLRSAAGYLTGPRPVGVAGASIYDRVMILATSRPPANTGIAAPSPYNRAILSALPPQPPPDDDEGEPEDQGPVPPPGMENPAMVFPGPSPPVNMPPGQNPNFPPGMNPNQNLPVTSPRPGVPQPQTEQPQPDPFAPAGRPPTPRTGRGGGGDPDRQ